MPSLEVANVTISLLSAVVGGLIVAFANHAMTRRREFEKRSPSFEFRI